MERNASDEDLVGDEVLVEVDDIAVALALGDRLLHVDGFAVQNVAHARDLVGDPGISEGDEAETPALVCLSTILLLARSTMTTQSERSPNCSK